MGGRFRINGLKGKVPFWSGDGVFIVFNKTCILAIFSLSMKKCKNIKAVLKLIWDNYYNYFNSMFLYM